MNRVTQAARLGENLARVRERIARAAQAAGRSAESVKLVAVTKYVSAEIARELVEAGCTRLGESRPQELWRKAAALADLAIEWHLVGHLQRNKVRRTLPVVEWIHSVDRQELLDQIESQERLAPVNVLVEINTSGEAAKHGLAPPEAERFLIAAAGYQRSCIRGLMTLAAREGGLATARRNFAALRDLRDRLRTVVPDNVRLDELSMGMSEDFEIAIQEGATMVRIGSGLFEGLAR
jgi:pyridoxal phosphate enzyme (YggS family)